MQGKEQNPYFNPLPTALSDWLTITASNSANWAADLIGGLSGWIRIGIRKLKEIRQSLIILVTNFISHRF